MSRIEKLKSKLTRRKVATVLSLFVFAAILLSILIIVNNRQQNAQPPSTNTSFQNEVAIASILSGQPQVFSAEAEIKSLIDGQEVTAGQTIITDDKSQALIIFPDNSIVTIDFNTKVSIAELLSNSNQTKTKLFLETGKIYNQVETVEDGTTEYTVETPTVVAAVRGTKFEVDQQTGVTFVDEGKVNLLLKKHNINVDLNPEDEILIDINDLDKYRAGLLNFIRNREMKNGEWDSLNRCIAERQANILTEKRRLLRVLRLRYKDIINCRQQAASQPAQTTEESPVQAESTPPTPEPTIDEIIPQIFPSVDTVQISIKTPSISCTYSGSNSTTYNVSVGTQPGANDIFDWVNTDQLGKVFSGFTPTHNTTYYCNVVGIDDFGNESDPLSSAGQNINLASASFLSVSPPNGGSFYGTVSSYGNYNSYVNINDLRVKYTIRNTSTGQYINASSNWQAGMVEFNDTVIDYGSPNFLHYPPLGWSIAAGIDLEISMWLYDNVSGKTYDTETVYVTSF